MKGKTVLSAYEKLRSLVEAGDGDGRTWARYMRQQATFQADLLARLKVSDTARRVHEANRLGPKDPEEYITALFGAVEDSDQFWSGMVARIKADGLLIETQKEKIAELEKERDDCRAAVHGMFGVDYPSEPSE